MADQRPVNCSVCYEVELSLRQGRSWQGQVPVREDQLIGWLWTMGKWKKELFRVSEELKGQSYWKKLHQRMLHEVSPQDAECIEDATKEFELEVKKAATARIQPIIQEKAQRILAEVTWGMFHEGQDSQIPSDVRFKRTREGNLFIGAGNLHGGLKEAAWRFTDNPGRKRWLGNDRLWTTPGKVVMYRLNGRFNRIPIKKADGRYTRHVPPESPGPQNFFRGKPATIVYAERIDYPAFIHFWLWTDPEVQEEDLRVWWEIAGNRGIMGYRQMGDGQFDVLRFQRVSEDIEQKLIAAEEAKLTGRVLGKISR